jgi:predicted aldo/keto reductase-like oxidoreductase
MAQHNEQRRTFIRRATLSAAFSGVSGVGMLPGKLAAASTMPTKQLGVTGAEVPILQLGTSQHLDQKYDKVMHRCFKEGVTAFDTALSYGSGASHNAIANFVGQMGDRKALWITSKSGRANVDGLVKDIDRALSQLRTDYLDLYFMHGINDEDMLESTYIEAGEKMKASGKTRFFGFSCHDGNVVELMNKAAKVGGIDAILFRYNFRRYGDRELNVAIDNCKKAGIGLIAMKTMGSVPDSIESVIDFESKDFTLPQAKLKSVWADERIDALVSEMDSVNVAKENIAAAKSQTPLTAAEAHQLNQLAALTANYACNGCSHLCEQAITSDTAIASQLRFLMYHECYGNDAKAKKLFADLSANARRFDAEELRKASAVCPQGIDIAARLTHAHHLLA